MPWSNTTERDRDRVGSIASWRTAMPLALKLGCVAALLAALSALFAFAGGSGRERVEAPPLLTLAPRDFFYRPAGEFTREGRPANAPLRLLSPGRALAIMAREVTQREYRRCVSDGGCPPTAQRGEGDDRPAVELSWRDAVAYAAWLSRRLDESYRLPTDEEWVFAAGSRARDEVLPEGGDPAQRWLARYEREGDGDEPGDDGAPRPVGSYGRNEYGLEDLSGDVWEWTDTCFARLGVTQTGEQSLSTDCGIRVAEGRHRAYLPDFIRDARAGGCAVGTPPRYLGLRLVREDGQASPWLSLIDAWL